MSNNNPIDLKQDRRQWLKTSASVLGASLLPLAAPAIADLPQGETPAAAPRPKPAEAKAAGRFFTSSQHSLVEELTETIIPADSHSGGAKAAKVADYIEKFLGETTDNDKKALWRECLPLIDSMSQHYTGKSFVDATPDERIAVLTVLSDNEKITDVPEVRFFLDLKKMTVELYYTTKIGIHDELEYKGNRINQEFVGCDDQGPAAT